jgi:hypothetical protein
MLNLIQMTKILMQFIVILFLIISCNCDFILFGVTPIQNRRVVRTFHLFLFTYFKSLVLIFTNNIERGG